MIHFISFTSYLNVILFRINSIVLFFLLSTYWWRRRLLSGKRLIEIRRDPDFWSLTDHISLLFHLLHSHPHITLSLSHFNLFLFYSYTLTLVRLSIELISTDFTPSKLLTHSAQVMAHISCTSYNSAADVITWLGLFFCPLFRSHHSDHNDDAITFTRCERESERCETARPYDFLRRQFL